MNLFCKKNSYHFPATFPKSCAKVFFFWNWKTFWPMMLELAPAWLWEVPKASGLGNLTSKLVSKSKKNSLFVQNVQIGYSFKEKQLSSSEFSIRNVWVVGCPPSICKNWRSFAICQNKNRNFPMNVCITSRRQIESSEQKHVFIQANTKQVGRRVLERSLTNAHKCKH